MSESAWQVIIKAYERELANAKTPEEAARWQAAIDNSLTEANKEVIVSEGRVRPTPEQKARRIELGKEKAAVADQQRLIDEGRINIFSAEESEAMYRADAEGVRRKPTVNAASSSSAMDKDMALRTYLEELGREKELEAGRSTWDKKHVDFGDFHDQAFKNTADSLGVSDDVLMDSLRSNDLYNEHVALEGWRDNRRWGQSPLRGDAHTGMAFDEVESRVQKNLTNFMRGTAAAPQLDPPMASAYIDEVGDIFDDISVRRYGRRNSFCG
jgi:hypothetical protein